MRRVSSILFLALFSLVAAPAAGFPIKGIAGADGLPVVDVDASGTGLASADGHFRYITFDAGQETIVAQVAQHGGHVLQQTRLDGNYTIPAVAYDGSASGLSADGRTLVLINPRSGFPREHTPLAVLDATSLEVRARIDLNGDFSFDAISPDGRDAYLIRYFSRDPSQYEVRVYDLERKRLVGRPITDPNEAQEEMYGFPMSRATSPDGRWAYTLYQGREHPFIHALDTGGRTAVCIDLDEVPPGQLARMSLEVSAGGGTIEVVGPDGPRFAVDTSTWAVTDATAVVTGSDAAGDGAPWALIVLLGGAGLCGLAALMAVGGHRRRARAADTLAQLAALDTEPVERTEEDEEVPAGAPR